MGKGGRGRKKCACVFKYVMHHHSEDMAGARCSDANPDAAAGAGSPFEQPAWRRLEDAASDHEAFPLHLAQEGAAKLRSPAALQDWLAKDMPKWLESRLQCCDACCSDGSGELHLATKQGAGLITRSFCSVDKRAKTLPAAIDSWRRGLQHCMRDAGEQLALQAASLLPWVSFVVAGLSLRAPPNRARAALRALLAARLPFVATSGAASMDEDADADADAGASQPVLALYVFLRRGGGGSTAAVMDYRRGAVHVAASDEWVEHPHLQHLTHFNVLVGARVGKAALTRRGSGEMQAFLPTPQQHLAPPPTPAWHGPCTGSAGFGCGHGGGAVAQGPYAGGCRQRAGRRGRRRSPQQRRQGSAAGIRRQPPDAAAARCLAVACSRSTGTASPVDLGAWDDDGAAGDGLGGR